MTAEPKRYSDLVAEIRTLLTSATPGPWEWRDTEEGFYCAVYGPNDKYVISPALHYDGKNEDGESNFHGYTEVSDEANARLIVLAPRMAETLRDLFEQLEALRAEIDHDDELSLLLTQTRRKLAREQARKRHYKSALEAIANGRERVNSIGFRAGEAGLRQIARVALDLQEGESTEVSMSPSCEDSSPA